MILDEYSYLKRLNKEQYPESFFISLKWKLFFKENLISFILFNVSWKTCSNLDQNTISMDHNVGNITFML